MHDNSWMRLDELDYLLNKEFLFSKLTPDATCHYCNCILNNVQNSPSCRSVDHVVPVSLGGGSELENLVVSCSSCNHRKSNHQEVMFYRLTSPQVLTDLEKISLSKVITSRVKMSILNQALSDFNNTGMSFEQSIYNNYDNRLVKGYSNRVIKELRKQESIEAEIEHLKLKISHQSTKLSINEKVVKNIKYDIVIKFCF